MTFSGSRITTGTIGRRVFDNLQGNLDRIATLQEQLSSGKQINRPSDSPSGTVTALQFRNSVARSNQYDRNIADGLSWLGLADSSLSSVVDQLQRARQIVLQGKNGASTSQDRAAIAAEIGNIRATVIGLANATYLDRPVFGGTSGASTAYDATGAYQGDNGTVDRNVAPGVTVRVDVSATSAFGSGASSIFNVLTQIATDLATNPGNLDQDLVDLDANLTQLGNAQADVGARYRRLEVMRDRTQQDLIALRNGLSEAEDIDVPKTILDLQLQQNAYQAALGASARVIQPSILDFLR